ncbi:hypothetical protein Tco_1259875 [Tanacetum coccineum]
MNSSAFSFKTGEFGSVETSSADEVEDCQSYASSIRYQQSKGRVESRASHETNADGRVNSLATHFGVESDVLDVERTWI